MIRQGCVVALILGLCQSAVCAVQPAPLSEKDAGLWFRYVVPLPKKSGIPAKLMLPVESVQRAAEIAGSIPDNRFLHEARYTLAVLEMARASRDLTIRLSGRKTLDEAARTLGVAAPFMSTQP